MSAPAHNRLGPFPSWDNFGFQNKNRSLEDRDSKFLFHYDEDTFESVYDGPMEFTTDEYEQSLSSDEYKIDTRQTKSKRRRLKKERYRKKRPLGGDEYDLSNDNYIGQPKRDEKKKYKKRKKRKKKKNGDRRESDYEWPVVSVMHSMLDFLSNPGDYFSNVQSSYAGGQGEHSFGGGGGGGYKGGGGGSSGYQGGGGASNPAAPGILDGLSGIIGDTTLSRKVGQPQKFKLYSLISGLGFCDRADHLVPASHLVPRLHLRYDPVTGLVPGGCRPGPGV